MRRHLHCADFPTKNVTFRARAFIPNVTKYCACLEKRQLNCTKYCTCHENWATWMQLHQILHLPRILSVTWVQLHYSAWHGKCTILWLYYSFILLFFDSTILILLLFYSLTLPFFCSIFLWLCESFVLVFFLTLLLYYSTMLWLYYSITRLCFDSTTLLFYSSFTLLLLYYFLLCDVVHIPDVSQLNFLRWT